MLLLNKCMQGVELLFPEAATFVQPLGGGLELPPREPAIGETAFFDALDQAGVFEDPEMF